MSLLRGKKRDAFEMCIIMQPMGPRQLHSSFLAQCAVNIDDKSDCNCLSLITGFTSFCVLASKSHTYHFTVPEITLTIDTFFFFLLTCNRLLVPNYLKCISIVKL